MRGTIAITETEVKYNKIGWTVFDFFKHHLKQFTVMSGAGWYAYKLENGIYYFKWADGNYRPSNKYLEALKKDGYELGISAITIEDAFK